MIDNLKTAKLPDGFPVGRWRGSKVLPRAISGRATGLSPKLPSMVSPLGGQAPARGAGSTLQGDVAKIQSRGKGTLSEVLAAKSSQKGTTQDRSPAVSQKEVLPPDQGANINHGSGVVRDAEPAKVAHARQLLRERLSDLRV